MDCLKILLLGLLIQTTTVGDDQIREQVRKAWRTQHDRFNECEVTWNITVNPDSATPSEYSFLGVLQGEKIRLERTGMNREPVVVPGGLTHLDTRRVLTDNGVRSVSVTYPKQKAELIWMARRLDDESSSLCSQFHRNQRVAPLLIALHPFSERIHGFSLDRSNCTTQTDGMVALTDAQSHQRLRLDPKNNYRIVAWEAPHKQPRIRTTFSYRNDSPNFNLPDKWVNLTFSPNQHVETIENCRIITVSLSPSRHRSTFEEMLPRGQVVEDMLDRFISRGDGTFRQISLNEWSNLKDSSELLELLNSPPN